MGTLYMASENTMIEPGVTAASERGTRDNTNQCQPTNSHFPKPSSFTGHDRRDEDKKEPSFGEAMSCSAKGNKTLG